MTEKIQVASGVKQLDHLLGGLRIGDNVVWYDNAGSLAPIFYLNFIKASQTDKKAIIYINFDHSIKTLMERLGDPTVSDYLLEFWYNNVLSGIPTHLVNTTSNTLWQMFQVPHRALTAIIDIPYSRLKGTARQRYLNEIPKMVSGNIKGWKRGSSLAGETFLKGKISDFESKWAEEMGTSVGAFERSPYPILRKLV